MYYVSFSGPATVADIVTGYGLEGPGIESRWGGEISRTRQDRPWGPPSLLYNAYRIFPVGKKRPGFDTETSPLLVQWSRIVEEYLYSHFWQYGQYRASVPIEWCTLLTLCVLQLN